MKTHLLEAQEDAYPQPTARFLVLLGVCIGLSNPPLGVADIPPPGGSHYVEGVSLLAWDAMTGRSHLCHRLPSSSAATQCGLAWCQRTQVSPPQACDLSQHCIFPGFASAAIGPYHNEETGFRFHASTACGERSPEEANRSALRRCEGEVQGPRHCKIVTEWQVK